MAPSPPVPSSPTGSGRAGCEGRTDVSGSQSRQREQSGQVPADLLPPNVSVPHFLVTGRHLTLLRTPGDGGRGQQGPGWLRGLSKRLSP